MPTPAEWLGDRFEDLVNVEVNTIEALGITGRDMPSVADAAREVARAYAGFMRRMQVKPEGAPAPKRAPGEGGPPPGAMELPAAFFGHAAETVAGDAAPDPDAANRLLLKARLRKRLAEQTARWEKEQEAAVRAEAREAAKAPPPGPTFVEEAVNTIGRPLGLGADPAARAAEAARRKAEADRAAAAEAGTRAEAERENRLRDWARKEADGLKALEEISDPNWADGGAGTAEFETLNAAAWVHLAAMREDEKSAGTPESDQAAAILYRILRNASKMKTLMAAHASRGLKPEERVAFRKIWEIKTDRIALQTVMQLDGDVVTRIAMGGAEKDKRLLEVHQRGVNLAFGYWKTVLTLLQDFATGGRR